MAERRADENGARSFERVECGAAGFDAGRTHAFLKPAFDFQPRAGFLVFCFVEAGLNFALEFLHSKRFVVEAAGLHFEAPLQRMQMAVDEAGHEEAAVQIGNFGGAADEGSDAGVRADVDDAAIADGDCFGGGMCGVRSEYDGVAEDAIGGSFGVGLSREKG